MDFQINRDIVLQIFVCSLLSISMTSQGTDTDIYCLKSIKDSLEDPNKYLSSSWNFNNRTEGFICRFNGVECWHPDENRVLNLKLSSMGLKGQFPRGLRNCSSMTGLDLSINEFSGPIPSDISEILLFATTIDLSNNKFTGEIPRSLANCTYLNTLRLCLVRKKVRGKKVGEKKVYWLKCKIDDVSHYYWSVTFIKASFLHFTKIFPSPLFSFLSPKHTIKLDNNMLSGQIPRELGLLPRLKLIDFANNDLSGQVPSFNSLVEYNFANNGGLCGGPSVGPCSVRRHGKFHQSFKGGLIVGYVLSLTCSVIVTCMSYSYCAPCVQLRKIKNNHLSKAKELAKYICSITRRRTRRVPNQMHGLQHLLRVEKGSKEISVLLERLTSTILFEELCDATECFAMDNAIGVGKMGMVYQGSLPNGQFLAVKRLLDSRLFKRQFLSEVMILGKYRHRNIVPLLGFYIEGKERLLAYAYMSNGRLSKWLHPLESEVTRLRWPERINIALGIARGLSWLHHSCDLPVVHLNICSECILLDENFEPKISNFGEAKFMNPNIEDDLGMIFKANDGKKDVYDFGSVLFELITGNTYNELSRSASTTNLCGNPSNFCNVTDKSVTGEGFENEVCTLLKIAWECVRPLPDQRPTMLEVYNNMSNLRKGRRGYGDDSDTHRELEIASAIISIEEIVQL